MREYLFKGVSKSNGKWVSGSLDASSEKHPAIFDRNEKCWIDVIEDTVSQHIGRADLNKNELFEGDILCAETGSRWEDGQLEEYTQFCVIVYNKDKARFEVRGKMGEFHKDLPSIVDRAKAYLVGNIYDNAEFLSLIE